MEDATSSIPADFFNPNASFHRACFFPEMITDTQGKERKRYRDEEMKTLMIN